MSETPSRYQLPDEHYVFGPFGVYPAKSKQEANKVRSITAAALWFMTACVAFGIVGLIIFAVRL